MGLSRSPKLVLYGSLAAVFFLTALVIGRPELVALGAPFALVLAVGLSRPRPGPIEVSLELTRERVVEGEEIEAELCVRPAATPDGSMSVAPAGTAYVGLVLPARVRVVSGETTWLLALDRLGRHGVGVSERRIPLRLVAPSWGGYRLGDTVWRVAESLGLTFSDGLTEGVTSLRVYPQTERLRSVVTPRETQPFVGNRVARARGEGIEFAETRPYEPGDRPRRVNWRATSVRQTLYVNEQHQERNSDVVIFLDTFAEAQRLDESTLDLAVRAAATLAEHYLTMRDRVGIVGFGAAVRWLTPGSGAVQRYRIVETLMETQVFFSFAWRGIDTLPARSLTPQAFIIALTPLLDERGVRALLDLRRRGFDLVVVETSPLPFVAAADRADLLASRLWRLWREATRFRLEQLGVAVVEWDGRGPLEARVEEVRTFRRFARHASRQV